MKNRPYNEPPKESQRKDNSSCLLIAQIIVSKRNLNNKLRFLVDKLTITNSLSLYIKMITTIRMSYEY